MKSSCVVIKTMHQLAYCSCTRHSAKWNEFLDIKILYNIEFISTIVSVPTHMCIFLICIQDIPYVYTCTGCPYTYRLTHMCICLICLQDIPYVYTCTGCPYTYRLTHMLMGQMSTTFISVFLSLSNIIIHLSKTLMQTRLHKFFSSF